MNKLLILGCGQFGMMVKEIAQETGLFDKISFLDDRNTFAIGRMAEYANFCSRYDSAVVAIGDPEIRLSYFEKLVSAGYNVPSIVSKFAYVSPSALLGAGVIVEPLSTIQAGAKIGDCTIVSSAAVVRHNANVGKGCHIDCGAVVLSTAEVGNKSKVYPLSVFG